MQDLTHLQRRQIEAGIGRYRVTDSAGFSLADIDPATTGDYAARKEEAVIDLQAGVEWLADAQSVLAAQDRWAILLVFQARDAAGKDSTIKHVMSGINPQGCDVTSFKEPSTSELDHDYLWRYHQHIPARGHIGIFNRSYYEEVLVARVHEQVLARQKLPPELVTANIWQERFQDINNFETYLTRNGVVIIKFLLHISKEEQKRRFMDRLDRPDKHWKFSVKDIQEREHWDAYTTAYEEMIRTTTSAKAPWYVVPADNKWYTRLVVAAVLVHTIDALQLRHPESGPERLAELDAARRLLEDEQP